MFRTVAKVVLVDAVLLVALLYVSGDLQWRVDYAASPHGHTLGYLPSFTYSVLIRWFSMTGGSATLNSPPTLDWVQLIVLTLAVVNVWFVYDALSRRKKSRAFAAGVTPSSVAG